MCPALTPPPHPACGSAPHGRLRASRSVSVRRADRAPPPPQAYEKGNISRYVSLLKLGDKVRIKGPKGQFKYHPALSREIGMIAGGTGITPMLQIVRAALKNPLDRTKLSLVYANVNAEDILLKKELDELAAKHAHRFRVYYVLNNPPPSWAGGVGFVTKEMIEAHMPPTDANIKVLLCGEWSPRVCLSARSVC